MFAINFCHFSRAAGGQNMFFAIIDISQNT